MFATIKSLIPEPRQADQPRHYIGRHRHLEIAARAAKAPAVTTEEPATASASADEADRPPLG